MIDVTTYSGKKYKKDMKKLTHVLELSISHIPVGNIY